VGKERIGIIIGDREFVGNKWLKYLKESKINFCFRVFNSHYIENADGDRQTVKELATQNSTHLKDRLVDGVWVNVYIKKLDNEDYLFLISNTNQAQYLGQIYKKRWCIETFFQSLKTRGFDMEETHIRSLERLKKMIAVVGLAYSFCVNVGIYYHEKVQNIKRKKHGYKSKSFCQTGIDLLQDWLKEKVETFEKKTGKFLRYLIFQKVKYLRKKYNPLIYIRVQEE
jgi:hypothetical protein